jgi:hypothetical protein
MVLIDIASGTASALFDRPDHAAAQRATLRLRAT